MGSAFYIVVNSVAPNFDTQIDGKALARHATQIDFIASQLGFRNLDAYCSLSPEDARAELASLMGLEEEDELPPDAEETLNNMPPEQWYDAAHGLEYATRLAEHIHKQPTSVRDPNAVLYDLNAMQTVFEHAVQQGLKWHLRVDY